MRALAFLLVLLLSVPASAGTVVSDGVSDVSVTIYRDPNRGKGAMDRRWPGGYALITETRTISLPAGESVIRFEGVAQGLLPESAIVTGLPLGVKEKNRDARLISPAGLVDAYLKRRVHLRRTDRATGRVRDQEAVIQAGPGGGVVLQTAEGVEALGCSGLPERMLYDGIPAGLLARPTLSVVTQSDRAVTATVQLSYLAQGFDWSANYVAESQGDALALFAWLTIANGGSESFANARLQVVAGQPNRERNSAPPASPPVALSLQCWPMDITSTHPGRGMPPPPPPPPPAPMMAGMEDVIVTAQRRSESAMMAPVAIQAVQEELGDLKLYRVPERVTIAANAQKQVAMLAQPQARFDRLYRASVDDGSPESVPMTLVLRGVNRTDKGLGLPLPAGGVAVFETVAGKRLLAGEDDLADRAIGDEVEVTLGRSSDVRFSLTRQGAAGQRQGWKAVISNARPVVVMVELAIPYELSHAPKGVTRKGSAWVWRTSVPANGTAELRYDVKTARVD